jgi:Rha family phage regulatory protein
MSNLINIINQEGNLVVSSREVAENFEKEHKHILESIDNLVLGLAEKSTTLFYETTYIHSQNKQEYREVLMNKDGFTLLAMGFTGKRALEWKLKYIETFNRMASELKESKKLSPMEQLKLQYEVLDEHEERISHLEGSMTVDFGQQNTLQNKAKSKIISILGGISSHSYKNKSLRSRVFSAIWRDYKDYFNVASYRDTARVDFQKALEYIENWQVQGKLLREIEDCNNQIDIEEAI